METTLKKDELIKKLANATVTYYECSGHHKAAMNELRCNDYKKALEEIGEDIPTDDELLKIGLFNGDGSY